VFDVIGKRNWFFAFSLLLTIPGLLFILLTPLTGGKEGLKFSIDYTGGTRWSIHFANPNVSSDDVKGVLVAQGLADSQVTKNADGTFDIRTIPLDLPTPPPSATPAPSGEASGSPGASGSPEASGSAASSASTAPSASASAPASPSASPEPSASVSPAASGSPAASASPEASASAGASASPSPTPTPAPNLSGHSLPTSGKLGQVVDALQAQFGKIDRQDSLTTIGPVISSDLVQQALVLILVGSIGILLWITFRFHDVKFGVTALAALVHDVIVVVGTFAVLGSFFGVEVDALFVTAMLTIIGFSVHDTIVVFDRVRENKARHAGEPFDRIVNHSILQTFGRSINTSFTVVLTLLALLLFGGSAIRFFVLALLIGIVSGTYSSIFNASPLLVVWQEWEDRRKGRTATGRVARRAGP
jgi:preprotein translocase SecF subunit